MENKSNYSFRRHTWQQFKQNKAALISFVVIVFLFLTALLSPFIANHHPLYVKYQGHNLYPAFSTLTDDAKVDTLWNENHSHFEVVQYNEIDWRSVKTESIWWTLVPYSSNTSDKYNRDYIGPLGDQRYKSPEGEITNIPTRLRHFMGTDKLGRDVASGIIHGSKISLFVGIFSMLIAAFIGVPLGAFAGYFGNDGIKVPRSQFWLGLLGLLLGLFVFFVARSHEVSLAFQKSISVGFLSLLLNVAIAISITILFSFIGKKLAIGSFLKSRVNIPIDSMVSRTIEILNSLPTLILIITIAAIINERSMVMLVMIIGLTSWTGIARFMRAEILRIKEMEYIQAAKAFGFSNARIIFKHALPNGLAPVFTTIAFGIASAILIESGLSFLGIGVPDDIVTWGNLLSLGREEFEASWLVIFPGLAIFVTVTAYNLIGEGLRDALDPKLRKK